MPHLLGLGGLVGRRMSPKKERPPKGGSSHNGAPTAKREKTAKDTIDTATQSVKLPWLTPQFSSLAHLKSRLIPLCKPNGVPGKCTCPHHKHEDASSGKAPIEKGWQEVGHKARWPEYEYNVGVRLGSTLNVLDIDPRNGGLEALRELEGRYGQLPRTPRVATGGGGYHYYLGAEASQASWKMACGVELKAAGSQVVAPGSLHQSGKLYEWDAETVELSPAPLPEWLKTKPTTDVRPRLAIVPDEDPRHGAWVTGQLQWKGEEFELSELVPRARLYLRAMPLSVSGKGGHDIAIRVAVVLIRGFLLKGEQALPLFEEWNVERAKPAWSKGELLHKLADATKFDKFQWGYALRGERDEYAEEPDSKADIPARELPSEPSVQQEVSEEAEAAEEEKQRKEDNRLVYVASADRFYFFPEGTDGTPVAQDQGLQGLTVSAAIGLLQDSGKSFRGAQDIVKKKMCRIVKDTRRWPSNERLIEVEGQTYLNPFWTLIPDAKKGDCNNLSQLLDAVAGDKEGSEWLWNWAAYVVQNPNIQPGVVVVARGLPGVGKSKLGEAIGLCRGVYTSVNNSAFHGDFNSKWADARFINAAEVMLADSKREDNQKFLSLVTDPEIEYHRKNQPAYDIPNRIAWWLTSNLDNPVLVPKGDRRFTILDALSPSATIMAVLKKAWTEYERRYHEWPELQAFKYKLLHWQVDVQMARKPLINAAHNEIQEASKSSVEVFADELELNGIRFLAQGLHGATSEENALQEGWVCADVSYLYRIYAGWCKEKGLGIFGETRFVNCGAMKRFRKTSQIMVRGVRYRMREVPIGTMEDS